MTATHPGAVLDRDGCMSWFFQNTFTSGLNETINYLTIAQTIQDINFGISDYLCGQVDGRILFSSYLGWQPLLLGRLVDLPNDLLREYYNSVAHGSRGTLVVTSGRVSLKQSSRPAVRFALYYL